MIVTAAKVGDVLYVFDVEVLSRMPFNEQLEVLKGKLTVRNVRKCCIDATGIGAMLAEETTRYFGYRAEGVVFNTKTKGEMYTAMRRAFEERTVRIPVDKELREDLHAVQKNVSTGGNISYSAPRSADGHSDRAAALALAIRAAQSAGAYVAPWCYGGMTQSDFRRI